MTRDHGFHGPALLPADCHLQITLRALISDPTQDPPSIADNVSRCPNYLSCSITAANVSVIRLITVGNPRQRSPPYTSDLDLNHVDWHPQLNRPMYTLTIEWHSQWDPPSDVPVRLKQKTSPFCYLAAGIAHLRPKTVRHCSVVGVVAIPCFRNSQMCTV